MEHKAYWVQNSWPLNHPVYRTISEHLPDGWQLTDSESEADLVLAPTWPNYKGSKPWVLFIEDWVTLYAEAVEGSPLIRNGSTAGIDVQIHPLTLKLRALFAQPNFRGILCHHPGTFRDLQFLNLTDKVHYFPIGLNPIPPNVIGQKSYITFVFCNTWLAGKFNFDNRGGMLMLLAFRKLLQSRTDCRLKILCDLEPADPLHQWALSTSEIQIVPNLIDDISYDFHLRRSDCLLLPSHRVHAHTLLRAFSYGLPAIVSDGWGLDCYVQDGFNGLIAKGVSGAVTFSDPLFREDYKQFMQTLPAVDHLAHHMTAVAVDRSYLQQIGSRAHQFVVDCHSVDRMRKALAVVFG